MFKKITAGLAMVSLAALLAVPAQAQLTMQPIEFDVNAGLALPMGDLGNLVGTGFGIGADGFLWTLDSMPQLKIGGRIAYNKFGEDNGWSASMFEIVPTVRYMLPSSGNMSFFGQGGIGIFRESYSWDGFSWGGNDDHSEMNLGITVGGGACFTTGGMKFIALPLLHLAGETYFNLNIAMLFGGK